MSETFTQVPPDSTGDKLAGQDFTRGANTVVREEVVIGNATGNTAMADVSAANGLEVDVTRSALPSGAATSAAQLADGHAVTVDNAGAGAAVNVQDGGNSITTDNDDLVSTNNSTSTPLGIGASFVGASDDVLGYTGISVQLDSSHDSATDGMTFEFSTDNTNWDMMHAHTYTAANGARVFQFATHAQFFRVNYTNGGTGQTTFRVQTILHRQTLLTTIHRLVDSVDPDRSAQLNKSAIIAQAAGSGDFVPVQATAAGNLKTSLEEVDAGVTIPISAASLPLPTGAATSAAQLAAGHTVTANAGTDLNTSALATSAGQLADGHAVTVDNASLVTTNATSDGWDNAASDGASVSGDVAHDGPDAGEPVKVGAKAISLGADPTEVAANDRTDLYSTRAGQLFTIGGHPNVLTKHLNITDTDGAQTDTNLLAAVVAATDKCVVHILQLRVITPTPWTCSAVSVLAQRIPQLMMLLASSFPTLA